jgi:hypothetical protein
MDQHYANIDGIDEDDFEYDDEEHPELLAELAALNALNDDDQGEGGDFF